MNKLTLYFSIMTAILWHSSIQSSDEGIGGKARFLHLSLQPPGHTEELKFESEHAPYPERTYYIHPAPEQAASAHILHPDQSSEKLSLSQKDRRPVVSFASPWKSKSMHGPNSVYVVDEKNIGGIQYIRTAKWIVIHHNCSWGHGHRFNKERLTPDPHASIPLEIVPGPLWDGNFHVNTQTGKRIDLHVFHYGEPAPGARVTVTTDRGWTRELITDEDGKATVQLIRDYYPESWSVFDEKKFGAVLFKAELTESQSGKHKRSEHPEVLTTTLPWRYRPASSDYTSLSYGLLVGFSTFALSTVSILYYRERRKKPYRRSPYVR